MKRVVKTISSALLLDLFSTLLSFGQQTSQALSIQDGVTNNLKRHEKFTSRYVDPRNVDVWSNAGGR